MAPIPVYTNSPINAVKATGTTPQTVAPAEDKAAVADGSTRTYTTSPRTQPPANTTPTPTRTIPVQQQPPPPQPGAVPRLPEATGTATTPSSSSRSSSVLPPLRPGADTGPAAPAPTAPPVPTPHIPGASYPPQMAIPPPQPAHQGPGYTQRGTSTAAGTAAPPPPPAAAAAAAFRPGLGLSDGPGGYRQNTSGFEETQYYNSGHGHGSGTATATGYGNGGGDGGAGDEEGEGLLGSAVKLAKAAGEKLSAAESEVWRRINGEGRT